MDFITIPYINRSKKNILIKNNINKLNFSIKALNDRIGIDINIYPEVENVIGVSVDSLDIFLFVRINTFSNLIMNNYDNPMTILTVRI